MKKRFQLIALLAVALLGACSGGKDKVAVEQVDEKPRVKLADVKARPVEQIHEYTATVEAEVKNNFCVVMFGLINVNILYYSFSTLYQMCNLRQSL